MKIELNPEQQSALDAMTSFLLDEDKRDSPYFLLSGQAGTGKTTTIRYLMERVSGKYIFTAPTNKATKVLESTFNELVPDHEEGEGYYPICCTTFSLLGLKLTPNGGVKEITTPDKVTDLSKFTAIIVDEASMVGKALLSHLKDAVNKQRGLIKIIFLGDEGQLPPVKEEKSPVWPLCEGNTFSLMKVMRHDNQILTLATKIRKIRDNLAPSIAITSDHSEETGGVRKVTPQTFLQEILSEAEKGAFSGERNRVKAIAWRNVTVDNLNHMIRKCLYPLSWSTSLYLPGDRIIITEPAASWEDGKLIASTDSEGTVEKVDTIDHPTHSNILCYRLTVSMDDGGIEIFHPIHEASQKVFDAQLAELAGLAKLTPRMWREYWKFYESFHFLRHGYAITSHRSQGSTYEKVFVDANDILRNRNRGEAFRCLYVACTRARRELIIT